MQTPETHPQSSEQQIANGMRVMKKGCNQEMMKRNMTKNDKNI